MTALLTAPPQYIATPWSAHATAKTVRFGAAPPVRLKGTFQSAMLPTVVSGVKAKHLKYLAGSSLVKLSATPGADVIGNAIPFEALGIPAKLVPAEAGSGESSPMAAHFQWLAK
jgi:hypothetical protein